MNSTTGIPHKCLKNKKLTKQLILRRRAEFKEVIEKGKLLRGKYVNLYLLESEETKVGFTVSRSFKKAVQRNRMKRLLREIYRNEKKLFEKKKLVFLAKKSDILPGYWELRSDVVSTLTKESKADAF